MNDSVASGVHEPHEYLGAFALSGIESPSPLAGRQDCQSSRQLIACIGTVHLMLPCRCRGVWCSRCIVAKNGRMGVPAERVSYLSRYFDSLVDLVPVKHYIDPDEVLDLRNMKRDERQQTKRAFKTQHKLSKRAKLDPDGDAHTTAAQRRQEAEEQRLRPNLLLLNQEAPSGAAGVLPCK